VIDRLAGLDQSQRLEQLIERAESTRKDDEGIGVADEHQLPGEEVVELDAQVDVGIDRLLVGQLDVEADRERAGVLGAAVDGLHRSGTASGDHREAGLADRATHLAGEVVLGCIGRRAGGTEHADRRADLAQLVEPEDELALDPAEALGLRALGDDAPAVGVDDLLVGRGRGPASRGRLGHPQTSMTTGRTSGRRRSFS
jgi:hypothetical protein